MQLDRTVTDSASDGAKRQGTPRIKILSVIVILQILVIVGLTVGLVYLVTVPPQTISVTGAVTSGNSQFFPDPITFIDTVSSVHYYTYVPTGWTVRSSCGSYSIILPDMHAYYVVTTVENSSGFVGQLFRGSNQSAPTVQGPANAVYFQYSMLVLMEPLFSNGLLAIHQEV
jgi:hypothetical protein